jgi:hypothetical protein
MHSWMGIHVAGHLSVVVGARSLEWFNKTWWGAITFRRMHIRRYIFGKYIEGFHSMRSG